MCLDAMQQEIHTSMKYSCTKTDPKSNQTSRSNFVKWQKKHGGHRNRSKHQVNMSSRTKDKGNFTNDLVSSINN